MIKYYLLFFTIIFTVFFLASPALALAPLVPACGTSASKTPCTTCDILVLGKNISDFILFYLVPAISAALFIYAGFEILLGGGIPGRVQQGYKIFQTTAYGLLIIFLAWLIVNTTLRTVAGDQNIAQNWWKLECRETVTNITSTQSTSSTGNNLNNQANNPNNPASSSNNLQNQNQTSQSQQQPQQPAAALACKFSGVNLCQGSTGCPTDACSQYASAIQKAAASTPMGGLNSAALITAFMYNESSCNPQAINGNSCGLMQLQPATANRFKTQCGIHGPRGANVGITCDWLRDPNNAEQVICLGAQYIKSLISGTCGNQIQNIAAGYNGGRGACDQSRDCAGDQSCSGGTVRKWECLYDNPQHTVCNTGYDETRSYAPKVLACYNNIK